MPDLNRPDGIDIHWEERGEGPLVVLAPFFNHHPGAFANLIADLTRDHRVARYDARGTGESTRGGPHDIETGAADLEAVIERSGPPAVVVTGGDGLNRALRVAAQRPDLISAILGVGMSSPVGFKDMHRYTDAMGTSDSVIELITEQLRRDYRGALRATVALTNPQMSEDEIRARVDAQASYCAAETAAAQFQAWRDDDPLEASRRLGDRLWLAWIPDVFGPLFPPLPEMQDMAARMFPEARVEIVEDGIVSRPDLTATIVRRITASARADERAAAT
jgi:pimeloyl-ACP methyl ester carboxylesterase